jgi:hypothetical protein
MILDVYPTYHGPGKHIADDNQVGGYLHAVYLLISVDSNGRISP